jgi:putative ABC transport system permease protein
VAQTAGVLAASCAAGSSVTQGSLGTVFVSKDGADTTFRLSPIDYDFLPLFDIKPVAGRLLSATRGEDDLLRADPATPSNPSLVVNETAARVLGFASPQAAVGQSVRWARIISQGTQFRAADSASSQIVGVIPDTSLRSVRETIDPTAYYVDPSFFSFLVLKLDGAVIQESLRKVNTLWGQFNPTRPLDGMFLSQHMNDLYADIRRQTQIFSAFSTVAVVLAALGLLGLAVFTAERRTREIALRKVMGALKWDILRFLSWQFARPVLLANLIAWPVAYFFMQRWLEGFAYHVGLSPLVFVLASVLALFIALATISGHALIVAGAKPALALRYE